MANFKVGDKARVVNVTYEPHVAYNGMVVTIEGPSHESIFTGLVYPISGLPAGAPRHAAPQYLAPLTPPAEDAWARDKVRELDKLGDAPFLMPEPEKTIEVADVIAFYQSLKPAS